MTTFCFNCKKQAEYTVKSTVDRLTIDGFMMITTQLHAFCSLCGKEVYPDEIVDQNTDKVNDLYREGRKKLRRTKLRLIRSSKTPIGK